MDTPDAELSRRISRASIKARFGGLAFALLGAMFLTLGYFSNSSSQREFTERMNSRSTPLDSTIDKIPPLAAGRALSTPLMNLMPFVMMGLGLLSFGMGAKTIAKGASPEERQDITEEYGIERLMQERRGNTESSLNSIVAGLLRHDGVYVRAQESDFDWKYLIFFESGRVRIPSSSLTSVRAFVQERRKDKSGTSTGGWGSANYELHGSTVRFSVPPLPKLAGRRFTGSIDLGSLRLKVEYYSASSDNLWTPKTVEYSFVPIPTE